MSQSQFRSHKISKKKSSKQKKKATPPQYPHTDLKLKLSSLLPNSNFPNTMVGTNQNNEINKMSSIGRQSTTTIDSRSVRHLLPRTVLPSSLLPPTFHHEMAQLRYSSENNSRIGEEEASTSRKQTVLTILDMVQKIVFDDDIKEESNDFAYGNQSQFDHQ